MARLELDREDAVDGQSAELIEVEIPTELYRKLALREGESLVVRPKKMQVFLDPKAAAGAGAGGGTAIGTAIIAGNP